MLLPTYCSKILICSNVDTEVVSNRSFAKEQNYPTKGMVTELRRDTAGKTEIIFVPT